MKTLILIIAILFSFFSFSLAQKQNEYKWGCSFAINSLHGQIEVPVAASGGAGQTVDADGNFVDSGDKVNNSLSLSIIPKYFLNDNVLLRFEFGMTNISLKNHFEPSYPIMIHDEAFKEKMYRFLPGVQWNFFKMRKVESYCGIAATYINFQTSTFSSYNEYRNPDNSIDYIIKDKETMPGGFAAGLNVVTGCNFYLQKHISFGAEISSAMLYYKIGGKTTSEISSEKPPNPPVAQTSTYSDSFKGFKIPKLLSSFNISIWL